MDNKENLDRFLCKIFVVSRWILPGFPSRNSTGNLYENFQQSNKKMTYRLIYFLRIIVNILFQSFPRFDLVPEKFTEIESSEDEISNILSVYFAEGGVTNKKPVLAKHLGLAAEEPREGNSLETLWELLPASSK